MENFTTPRASWDQHRQQAVKKARQTIELVFMNTCRIHQDSERVDHEFMLQWIHDLAKSENKIDEESEYFSIDRDILKIALAEILQSK